MFAVIVRRCEALRHRRRNEAISNATTRRAELFRSSRSFVRHVHHHPEGRALETTIGAQHVVVPANAGTHNPWLFSSSAVLTRDMFRSTSASVVMGPGVRRDDREHVL